LLSSGAWRRGGAVEWLKEGVRRASGGLLVVVEPVGVPSEARALGGLVGESPRVCERAGS